MKKCNALGCDRPAVVKGLCGAHDLRRRSGAVVDGPIRVVFSGSPEVRLKARLEIDEETGCHIWRGKRTPDGYGRFAIGKGRQVQAHRFAWEIANEKAIPKGKIVMHTCDNRACCNPEHLKLGTTLDNIRDRMAKGRQSGCWARDLERYPQWRHKGLLCEGPCNTTGKKPGDTPGDTPCDTPGDTPKETPGDTLGDSGGDS